MNDVRVGDTVTFSVAGETMTGIVREQPDEMEERWTVMVGRHTFWPLSCTSTIRLGLLR